MAESTREFLHGELIVAADRGDTAAVAKFLDLGADVNDYGPKNCPALLMATRNGHIDTMRLLLERGAHPNPGGSHDYTALTHAIHRSLRRSRNGFGDPDPVPLELLMAAGARCNPIDAVLLNDVELVKKFLDDGCDVNEGEGSYNGPLLMEAARRGHVEMVDLLLDRGAKLEAEDDLHQTALMAAANHGQIEIVKRLIDRGAEIASELCSRGALSLAAIVGHQEVVAYLLARGARWGLHDAIVWDDIELFEVLLEEEIRITAEELEPEKVTRDQIAIVDYVRGDFDRIAMEAVARGKIEFVRLLLDRGAAHHVEDFDHHSLLAEASKHGHVEIARLLIDRGADLHAVGRDYVTALAWAIKHGHAEVVELLRQAGAER